MNVGSLAPDKDSRSTTLRLLLASPIIWSVYHLVGYFLVEVACTTGVLNGRILGLNALAVVVTILTLLALASTLVVGLLSFRRGSEAGENQAPGESREQFLGMVGGLFSIVLALIILADGAAILVLGPCG